MAGSYQKMVAELRDEFVKKLFSLRRTKISTVLKSKRTFAAVYFIFDRGGSLIYVGKTKSSRKRLIGHLSPGQSSGLLTYVAKNMGLRTGKVKGHRCLCGNLTACSMGSDSSQVDPRLDEVSKKAADSHYVVFLVGSASAHMESLMTHILKPAYGSDL